MVELQDIREKQRELEMLIKEYEAQQLREDTGWGIADSSKGYYYIQSDDSVKYGDFMPEMYSISNMFLTKEKANEIAIEQQVYRTIKRWCDFHDREGIDWSSNRKYYLTITDGVLGVGVNCRSKSKIMSIVYFSSRELAEQCIKENRELLEKAYGISHEC